MIDPTIMHCVQSTSPVTKFFSIKGILTITNWVLAKTNCKYEEEGLVDKRPVFLFNLIGNSYNAFKV